jgi:hypothetical protein
VAASTAAVQVVAAAPTVAVLVVVAMEAVLAEAVIADRNGAWKLDTKSLPFHSPHGRDDGRLWSS